MHFYDPGWNRGLVMCQVCYSHYHSPEYETCFRCRPPWIFYRRKEFTGDQKLDIMARDDYRCQRCGSDDYLQVDHIMPCMRGGEPDPWNGQTLCGKCNYDKGGGFDEISRTKRDELIHFYLTFGWAWLTPEEQALLVAEASNQRRVWGYIPLSQWFEATELEVWLTTSKRKIVIHSICSSQGKAKVVFVDGRLMIEGRVQGPVPPQLCISGQFEACKAIDHGSEFLWHAHVTPPAEPPQWAIDEADEYHLDPVTGEIVRYDLTADEHAATYALRVAGTNARTVDQK